MKLKSLKLKNFAKFSEIEVNFDENVTYLIGNNGAGKSTIGLTGLWFIFQGIAEKSSRDILIGERFRFIGDYGKTASGELVLYDEKTGMEVQVTRKLTKDSASLISFIAPEGMELDQAWLDDLFNVFMINPKKFTQLTSKEQAIALGIDTTEYDTKLKTARSNLATNRNAIKTIEQSIESLGDITEITEGESPDEVKVLLDEANTENAIKKREYESLCHGIDGDIATHNSINANISFKKQTLQQEISILTEQLKAKQEQLKALPEVQKEKVAEYPIEPEYQNTEELTARWQKAVQDQGNAKQLTTYKSLVAQKDKIIQENETLIKQGKKLVEEKTAFIQSFPLPDANLTINEDGELMLREKPLKEPYFSTGELVKIIPVLMSMNNPELKFIFIQDFLNLDEENQEKVVEYLVKEKGFQLLIEVVGEKKLADKNCILLREGKIVTGNEQTQTTLL
jgi:DNA repair ATPase RecN